MPQSKPHYAPDLPVKLEHVLLDVKVDPRIKAVTGQTTQRVRVVAPDTTRVRLDQVGLSISAVTVGGKDARFVTEGNALWVELGAAPAVGAELEIGAVFSVSNPRRGIYFTGPDEYYPGKPYQIWAQGQDEDNQHWFPIFDYPNQKATSEVIVTVPRGFTAVSNGALLSKQDVPDGTRFHYKLGTPHVTYLITLAVAEFSSWEDKGPRGLPVQYFVQPGREADGKRAFGNTPKMIEAYERKIGVEYAYEKYSQVAVQDFIFGGMENTSATTQTDRTLHDERAHPDFSSDPLVSHELAHQWFGDLVTCRDWSHGWLNEGFATFMERVWVEEGQGEGHGPDEAKYYSYMDLKDYLRDDCASYRRPIVCNRYIEPMDLFDSHLYQKGGLVLNLVRSLLGADLFWKSVQAYVKRHRGGSVETLDLIRSIEETTGRNLRRVFDEWVFGAGHPDFELAYTWHEDKKQVELLIEQRQTGGRPSITERDATTHLFHLPVVIELTLEGDQKLTHRLELGEARERLFLSVKSKPIMVRFDPESNIPKTLKFPRPKELLVTQLTQDKDCMGRIEAAQELTKVADVAVVRALGAALRADKFWGVQAELAKALGEIRIDAARDELLASLGIAHSKARRAVVEALAQFRDDRVAAALKPLAVRDSSYLVEAEAVMAWVQTYFSAGRAAGPDLEQRAQEAEAFLFSNLEKDSHLEFVRAATLRALGSLPGVARGERPRVMAALCDWTRRGRATDARIGAVAALGTLLVTAAPAEKARILAVFSELVEEDCFRLRGALVAALAGAGVSEGAALLMRLQAVEIDGRIRRGALVGAMELEAGGSVPETISNLRTALEKLEEEHRKLRSKVEELQTEGR